jgi:Fic family protein
MPYIHEHPEWPTFTWDADRLAAPLAAARHREGRLIGRMESLGFSLRSEANLSTLTSDVVTTSAIEGERLAPAEVRSSIARKLGMDAGGLPPGGARREVDGIVEVALDAAGNAARPLTASRLFSWHSSLFRKPSRRMTVGAWRTDETGPMQVVSGSIGYEKVHFEAPGAERLDREMSRFLEWFNAPDGADPVLRAGIAHFWFVTIHPFDDGNGRIARAIADMCLARSGQTPQRFYSMSAQIQAERREYYLRLESAQRGTPDITSWLAWFIACLDRAIEGADAALASVLRKAETWKRINDQAAPPLNERQRLILNRLLDNFRGHLTTAKYASLARCSNDTALRDINDLLARGILAQNPGRGRSASYRLADPP